MIDNWLKKRTYHHQSYGDIEELVRLKNERGLKISVGLPTKNVDITLGPILGIIKKELMEDYPLVDQLAIIDGHSDDQTVRIAKNHEVAVFFEDEILPSVGIQKGKGEALWKSLAVLDGDIVIWVDSDIENFNSHFIYGLVGALLKEEVKYVKAFYRRPIHIAGRLEETGGGRVTELVARPILNLFYPELAGIIQPLSGEYGGYRDVLEQIPFYTGYAVETGMLVEILRKFGAGSIGQVDMAERIHANQSTMALGRMSFAILEAVFEMLQEDGRITLNQDINDILNIPSCNDGKCRVDKHKIEVVKRAPMIEVPEYAKR
ncbi:MAG: glucosyl-3-phosphoglycerate synthase [Actinobacteria bacterium]|nr:MAG: glucosyl-3-phosphoglycerate synthase [Actinomycetota bacterium]